MGIGPVYAIPMVLRNVGINQDDVDLFEVRLLIFVYKPVNFTSLSDQRSLCIAVCVLCAEAWY